MVSRRHLDRLVTPTCPECKEPLTTSLEVDKKTLEVKLILWCQSDWDDSFVFEVPTGLSSEGLARLRKGKNAISIPMNGKLVERRRDPEIERPDTEDEVVCDRCGIQITDDMGSYIGILEEDYIPYSLCEDCGGLLVEKYGEDWYYKLGKTKKGVNTFRRWTDTRERVKEQNWKKENK